MSRAREDFPSATLLAQLEALRFDANSPVRAQKAWEIVVQASRLKDFYVVFDFAIEQGLVLGGDGGAASWVNPVDELEMIWIPPGSCYLGDDKRKVTLPGFSLARHPVTNSQFARFLDETGYEPPAAHTDNDLYLHHWSNAGIRNGQENHPVVYVSYLDALAYCRWADLTLPTEWMWEKAARGADGRRYPWGEERPFNLAQVRERGTCAVGSFPRVRSPYGCEDLVGNVSEWCQMTPGDQAEVIPINAPDVRVPSDGETVYAAVRGSCFLRRVFWRMVSARRRRLSVTRRNRWVGFRSASLLPCRPAGGAS